MEGKFIALHDPNAKKPYGFDWGTSWLGAGDMIDTSTWSIDPTGPTLSSPSNTDTTTYVTISGGTPGQKYRVINDIVTTDGLEDRRSFVLVCLDR